ncbi:hypothetical protein PVAG01_01657 [Phlyctema vagabunda]|uniref:Uncharacterized protein n=1 Tax=Phlyctema vagabunda TaxID=108571 RepID=A0ABR4PXS7_9HELO
MYAFQPVSASKKRLSLHRHKIHESHSQELIRPPRFHLLIQEKENRRRELCQTILSSAILKYPPPILVSSGAKQNVSDKAKSQADVCEILDNLLGPEIHGDDMVLIVEDDVWLQLPSTVLINRFIQTMDVAQFQLVGKYGRSVKDAQNPPDMYVPKVLFGAQKSCHHSSTSDFACRPIPESTLPPIDSKQHTGKAKVDKHSRPRYLNSGMIMGRAADVRALFEKAEDRFEISKSSTTQDMLTEIYGRQEYGRRILTESNDSRISAILIANGGYDHILPPIIPGNDEKDWENLYGIEVDYTGSLFQVMENSEEDVRFMSYEDLNLNQEKLGVPADLTNIRKPFFHRPSKSLPSPAFPMPDGAWSTVNLAVNVAVPNGVVPAALGFRNNEKLTSDWWEQMWFHNHSRALLASVHNNPLRKILSRENAKGGKKWWDLRVGGKGGGVWMGLDQWQEWDQICGSQHKMVFGDNRGPFGTEDENQNTNSRPTRPGQAPEDMPHSAASNSSSESNETQAPVRKGSIIRNGRVPARPQNFGMVSHMPPPDEGTDEGAYYDENDHDDRDEPDD